MATLIRGQGGISNYLGPPGLPGDPLRGPSVLFMKQGLVKDMRDAGLGKESTVYVIDEPVIRGKSSDVTCPRDKRKGSAYVDVVKAGARDAGRAGVMLSYSWGYQVFDIIDSLEGFCYQKGMGSDAVYVWVCCLCINQHRVRENLADGRTVEFNTFAYEFGSRVSSIGKVLCLLAPWRHPVNLKRVWCIFEIHTAMQLEGCEMEFTMPPREAADFIDALNSESHLDPLWRALADTDVERADASIPEDKEHILKLVSEATTVAALNEDVTEKLKSWFIDTAEKYALELCVAFMQGSESSDQSDHREKHAPMRKMNSMVMKRACTLNELVVAKICDRVAEMLRKLKEVRRARQLLEQGHAILAASTKAALDSEVGADLVMHIGQCKWLGDPPDNKGGMEDLREARRRRGACDALLTEAGASLLHKIGSAYREMDDYDACIDSYEEAKRVYVSLGLQETKPYSNLIMSIGLLYSKRKNGIDALKCYEESRRILEKQDNLRTPDGAKLLDRIGDLRMSNGDTEGADAARAEATTIRAILAIHTDNMGIRKARRESSTRRGNRTTPSPNHRLRTLLAGDGESEAESEVESEGEINDLIEPVIEEESCEHEGVLTLVKSNKGTVIEDQEDIAAPTSFWRCCGCR